MKYMLIGSSLALILFQANAKTIKRNPSSDITKEILLCSTGGDAIGAVDVLVRSDKKTVVRVTELDDSPPVDYIIQSGFKYLLKNDHSTTIIAQEADGAIFGGGYSKASLLRVLPNAKTAFFAKEGYVYELNCTYKK